MPRAKETKVLDPMLESWKIVPNTWQRGEFGKIMGWKILFYFTPLHGIQQEWPFSGRETQKGNLMKHPSPVRPGFFVKIETKLISCVAFWTYMLWNWTIILGRHSTRGKWWYRPKQWTSLMQCDIMWIIALSLIRWIVQLQSVWEQTNQLEGKHEGNDQVRSLASQSWTGSGAAAQEDAEVQEDHRGQETRNNNQRLTYMLTGRGRSV